MYRSTISRIAGIIVALLAAGCGGQASGDGGRDVDVGTITVDVRGKLSRRGSTPFSLMLLQSSDGTTFMIQSTRIGDELRNLDGMEVAVTGVLVPNDEDVQVLSVMSYDLLRVPSGERPVVGLVFSDARASAQTPVWLVDRNDVYWSLRGDFEDILKEFVGAKVWVTGVVQRSANTGRASMRTILVTEYGVLRR